MQASPVVPGCSGQNPLEDARLLRYMDIVEILEVFILISHARPCFDRLASQFSRAKLYTRLSRFVTQGCDERRF